MRYFIDFNKTINQLVPYYMGGRKLILYLQSLMGPLKAVNEAFVQYAKETRIEASMTSQIFRFEWYLNRKFSKYFQDPSQRITITNGGQLGAVIYNESATGINDDDQFKLYYEIGDGGPSSVLNYNNERIENMQYSFIVNSPAINHLSVMSDIDPDNVSQEELMLAETKYKAMLSAVIEKYRLANKTYTIIFNS